LPIYISSSHKKHRIVQSHRICSCRFFFSLHVGMFVNLMKWFISLNYTPIRVFYFFDMDHNSFYFFLHTSMELLVYVSLSKNFFLRTFFCI
jgi:hypothetical protein